VSGEVIFDLFKQLPAEARAALQGALRPVRLDRGDIVHHPEDPADAVYLVERGRIRLYRIGDGAREVSLAVCGPGEVFGEAALAARELERYDCYAEALEASAVQTVSGEALTALLREHPTVSVALSAQFARQLKAVHSRLADMVFLEVSQRLAQALLRLAREFGEPDRHGTRLRSRVSHQDLAHIVGSTRETVTKILGEFKARGYLELGYRRIVLTDLSGLRHAAETRWA
jgi:CRP-like cAMP-binding protein